MKNTKRDTNIASIYFTQKRWTWIDSVSSAMIAIGAAILILWNGYGRIGIPILLIGAVIKAFSSNSKVKDSDYDAELDKLIKSNYIETHRRINDDYADVTKKITICNYDLSEAPVIVDNHGKARSKKYFIATFDFKESVCALELCEIDIPEKKVSVSNYSLRLPCEYELIEKTGAAPQKKCASLKIDGLPAFPVDANSTDTDVILQKLS